MMTPRSETRRSRWLAPLAAAAFLIFMMPTSSISTPAVSGWDKTVAVECHYHSDTGETHCTSHDDCLPTCYTGTCCPIIE